jgi:hypothetical protein
VTGVHPAIVNATRSKAAFMAYPFNIFEGNLPGVGPKRNPPEGRGEGRRPIKLKPTPGKHAISWHSDIKKSSPASCAID